MRFDAMEICRGVGGVSRAWLARGLVVGPIIDISYSRCFVLRLLRLLEWLLWQVWERRVRLLALEPPCSSFASANIRKSGASKYPLASIAPTRG